MGVYLCAKFEVSSIILTGFRQSVILSLPTSKRTPKKPTQIRVKKGFRGSKENYRSVSILLIISKIFAKLLSKQIIIYIDKFLSKHQCVFRKGYNAQHCLLAMIEKWKKAVDNGNVFGALLTDLSKAFDCLPHDLIIAKLNSYGLN